MAETVTPESLASSVLENAPEPTIKLPNAPTGAAAAMPAADPKQAEIPKFDSLGRPFDPKKFLPKCDTMGRWCVRRSGKSTTAGSPASPAHEIPEVGPGETPAGDPQPSQPAAEAHAQVMPSARAAAEGVAIGLYTVGALVIDGQEWMPEPGEHEPLVQAWESYFKITGTKDTPPWMAPALATAIFMGKRFMKPKTRTFFEKVKAWFFNAWMSRKGRQQSAELGRRMESSVSQQTQT
jgi:hypothetical protein